MEEKSIEEYGKLYNEGLYSPSDKDIMTEEELPKELQGMGIKAYNAGTDFKMIVRVIKDVTDNSKQRWNQGKGKIKTDYMCVSYIRNDMQATYAKDRYGNCSFENDLTFGFRSMDEESLLYTAYTDINSREEHEEDSEVKNVNSKEITEKIRTSDSYGLKLSTPDELIKNMSNALRKKVW